MTCENVPVAGIAHCFHVLSEDGQGSSHLSLVWVDSCIVGWGRSMSFLYSWTLHRNVYREALFCSSQHTDSWDCLIRFQSWQNTTILVRLYFELQTFHLLIFEHLRLIANNLPIFSWHGLQQILVCFVGIQELCCCMFDSLRSTEHSVRHTCQYGELMKCFPFHYYQV